MFQPSWAVQYPYLSIRTWSQVASDVKIFSLLILSCGFIANDDVSITVTGDIDGNNGDGGGGGGRIACNDVCYDLTLATSLCSPPCHGTPFPCPLHPILAHSCISSCTCCLSRVHRLEVQPLVPLTPYQGCGASCPLDSVSRMWSLLSPWLRTKEVRPLVPPDQLTLYRYTQEAHHHSDTGRRIYEHLPASSFSLQLVF